MVNMINLILLELSSTEQLYTFSHVKGGSPFVLPNDARVTLPA